ncbi:secretin N-terminal domain-containing protein [Verrucomicrobium spinosum]|uniref:secretin N-terminal domain-containing protein n=1 Tax=Verrucomicrobium spinosum TaxID=2736 RepID=UPI0001744674|nr:secretin N-terminal domain-containing protein [Verrucomicrobium spinosum]
MKAFLNRAVVLSFLALAGTLASQDIPAPSPGTRLSLQKPGAPIGEILEIYQELTGKKIIRDPKLEGVVLSMDTGGEMPKAQVIEFIEKSLLISGYAIVPSGEQMVKVLAFEAGKLPSTEGVDMILDASRLPQGDQVVSYLLPLQHLDADEAGQALSQIITLHPYGKILAVPKASALVITENSTTIRAIIDLVRQVDTPSSETTTKKYFLERADAEEVARTIGTLLGLDATATATPAAARSAPGDSRGVAKGGVTGGGVITAGGNGSGRTPPKLVPIARQNALLVIARPVDMAQIETLIKEFDDESPIRSFISRKVRYMDLTEFVEVAQNALLRGVVDPNGPQPLGQNTQQTSVATSRAGNTSSDNGGRSSSYGSGLGGGSGFGGGAAAFQNETRTLEDTVLPRSQSILIGKTLVIVDPPNSTFYASGPPDQLRMLDDLLTQMDKRPPQIILSAIIGEFTTGKDFRFGLDWVRTLEQVNDNLVIGGINKTSTTETNAMTDLAALGNVADFLPALQGLTVYGKIGKHLNVFLNTLEESDRFHVLQRPYVTTLNHKKATISTGQQLAIPGQTYSSGIGSDPDTNGFVSNTQYIPAELKLDIVPHIYDKNEVKLEFVQQNLDIASYTTISGNQVPNLSTQTLSNTVVVPNGATIILGGLITERDRNNKSGVPVLSRIPLVKHLFGSTAKTKERRELMIFVQPIIVASDDSIAQKQVPIENLNRSFPEVQQFAEQPQPTPLLPAWDPPPAKAPARQEKKSFPAK